MRNTSIKRTVIPKPKVAPPKRPVRGANTGSSYDVMPRGPEWWSREMKAGSAVEVCRKCHAIYYDKHWHTWSNAATRLPDGALVKETLCRACATLETKRGNTGAFGFEGEIVLTGLGEGSRKQEVLRLVRNIGSRAVRRDPEDQIIKIEDKGTTVRITTTENQLAVAIGKQIERAFKGGTLEIKWSAGDLPARVTWKDRE